MKRILVVDDDVTFSKIIENYLKKNGYNTDCCHNIKDAVTLLSQQQYAVLLLDYRLPDGTGLDVMAAEKKSGRYTPAIIMTSFNDVRTAVKAMRSGAFDYITKPVNQEELLMRLAEAIQTKEANEHSGTSTHEPFLMPFVEGVSPEAQKLQHQIQLIAPTDMSVIIYGESGTGKEYVARQIHHKSERSKYPFIAVDCGTLSTELAASELFGHVKGAFTGALNDKTGKFEAANGGTLFLDEMGNLDYGIQVKLLRALQEKIIVPVGSNREISFDVRIIAATNEDIKAGSGNGKFREDLYHRLNEFTINVPALRQRRSDLPLFVEYFIKESNHALKKTVEHVTPEVMELFEQYDWPGNIRELKNIVKRLVLLAAGSTATKDNLPDDMLLNIRYPSVDPGTDLKLWQENKERELIEKTLIAVKYNKQKAAKLLNINRSTLYAKMDKYKISG